MLETRKVERVWMRPVIRYWTVDRNMMISQAYDVSASGIAFNTGKTYAPDTPVYVQLRSMQQWESMIFFKARIIHQQPLPQLNLFKTGAEIVAFKSPRDSALLNRYIEFARQQVN